MIQENKIFSKIFFWMFVGLAITFGVGYYTSLNENMLYNIFSNYYMVLIIAEIIVVIWLSARIRKMKPLTAKILFCLYSFITGLTFSSIFIVYKMTSIISIFGVTSLIFLVFALIGYFTKADLSKLSVYLFMGLVGIIICSLINLFIGNETFDLGITVIGVVIFIAYIAYDIQIIKRNLYGFSQEDNLAIFGALQLYLDFINIFIKLLRLFAKRRD